MLPLGVGRLPFIRRSRCGATHCAFLRIEILSTSRLSHDPRVTTRGTGGSPRPVAARRPVGPLPQLRPRVPRPPDAPRPTPVRRGRVVCSPAALADSLRQRGRCVGACRWHALGPPRSSPGMPPARPYANVARWTAAPPVAPPHRTREVGAFRIPRPAGDKLQHAPRSAHARRLDQRLRRPQPLRPLPGHPARHRPGAARGLPDGTARRLRRAAGRGAARAPGARVLVPLRGRLHPPDDRGRGDVAGPRLGARRARASGRRRPRRHVRQDPLDGQRAGRVQHDLRVPAEGRRAGGRRAGAAPDPAALAQRRAGALGREEGGRLRLGRRARRVHQARPDGWPSGRAPSRWWTPPRTARRALDPAQPLLARSSSATAATSSASRRP